jgi:hypothetical protein
MQHSKYSSIFLTLVMLIFISCEKGNSNKGQNQNHILNTSDKTLKIETFSTFPSEIDGCSCYFSNDSNEFKNDKYIYVNDFAQTSFLKINGVIVKFNQTFFKKVNKTTTIAKAKSNNYEIIIEVKKGKPNGDETWLNTGTIKLKDRNGKTITKTFYGECGC